MRKSQFLLVAIGLLFVINLQAQNTFMPEKLHSFGPIGLQKPILLDSVNLNNTPFSDEILLSYSVVFPEQARFTTELTPDSSGFFHLERPDDGRAFQ